MRVWVLSYKRVWLFIESCEYAFEVVKRVWLFSFKFMRLCPFIFYASLLLFNLSEYGFKCGMRVWVLIGQASMGFRPHATLVLSFHASFGLQKFKRVWVWSKSCDFSFFLHTMRVWNLRPSEYGFWSSEYRFRVTLVSSDSSFASFVN